MKHKGHKPWDIPIPQMDLQPFLQICVICRNTKIYNMAQTHPMVTFQICALTLPKKTQHPKLTIKHHKIDRLSLYKEHSRTAVLAETSFEGER